ncbi:rho guanine nucleotide exchange factor 28 isoform X3 [Chroicocephalus ridibundus]|uniref:rho guanine nucleotide exchange factor 28 isoform X3 n=1 Tax=Chroicocephalus ridibundus TaxID=1192867 RepID=UPI002FDE331E
MELSCAEVPLYGQLTINARFDKDIYLPEDAEFYFVYDGSLKRHVVFAERISDNALRSIAPGHGCQETVSVSVLMYTRGYSPVVLGTSPVAYTENLSCKLSRFLVDHAECVTAAGHEMLLDKSGLGIEDLQSLDNDLTMAVAHEKLPSTWNILGSSEGEPKHKETLLHIVMKLGLVKLSQLLAAQPGGSSALALPNEDGATPLDLALQNGHSELVDVFTNLQGSPSLDISRAEIGEGVCMQFVRSSGALTLTFSHTTQHLLESDIKLFRKYFWNRPLLYQTINSNFKKVETMEGPKMPCSTTSSVEGPMDSSSDELSQDDTKASQDSAVPSKENEDLVLLGIDRRQSTLDVLRKLNATPTWFAATMLSENDEVFESPMVVDQGGDSKANNVHGDSVISETCLNPTNSMLMAESSSSPSLEENDQDPNEGRPVKDEENAGLRHTVSPLGPYTAGSYLPFETHGFIKDRGQLSADMRKKSSSLDDLDVDRRSGGVSDRSHVHNPPRVSSEAMASSRDGLDLSNHLQLEECTASGIRSRSYSCSLPKGLFGSSVILQDFTAGYSSGEQTYSLTEESCEKRIEKELGKTYVVASVNESEKCKVGRTFSFLMNRMTSTRNKCKTKSKDTKDKEKLIRHNFTNGTFSGVIPCMACEKALLAKESLQCSHCSMIVHKNCKESAPVCTKKSQKRYHTKNKPQAGAANLLPGDISQAVLVPVYPSTPLPVSLCGGRREASQQSHFFLSKSVPSASFERRSMPFSEQDSETSTWRSKSRSEEMLQALGTFSSMDSFMMEDDVDFSQWSDLCTDAQEFEAESWSLVVDPVFCSKQEKDVIKRQDVIFELIQTEVHHIHTLFIMSEIFRKGMKEELQLDHCTVDRIFPCLDALLEMHKQFFCRMKERRQESCGAGSERNFVINRIGDILVQQFSEENATKMKKIYGEFCSHQKEAVNLFKVLQQNKKFQNFIKLKNSSLLARRQGIPECILLVTQRITKYPVLVERILQYTKEGTEEHKDLCKALSLIKDVIAAVDLKVNEYEKKRKLFKILSRTENKTFTKLKNGRVFRKQDLMRKERILLHDGLVYWKTATGRFKDILAVLLTDMLLFLQEKDQKYIFAAVDQKPSVISLQRLIVREVANEERGMFLISASSAGPEMYEVHTSSIEERNNWMRHIQDAVESCPEEEEEGKMSESDEDRRIAEAKAYRIQKCQESLSNQDQQICSYLEEKLHICAELGDIYGFEGVRVEPHLLIKPDSGETPQAALFLAAALREVENLHVALMASQVSETEPSSEKSIEELSAKCRFSDNKILEVVAGDAEIKEAEESPEVSPTAENEIAVASLEHKGGSFSFPRSTRTQIVQSVQNLTRLLYSMQAALAIQDSRRELHSLLLQESEKTCRGHGSWLNLFLEQEKYRNLEKQRMELANTHKLRQQFQQGQQWWLRECERREREQEVREGRLGLRERECRYQEELLERSQQDLALQLQDYQQSLQRLQEGQAMVEGERNVMRIQKQLIWHWSQSQQSSLLLSTGTCETTGYNQSDSLCDGIGFCLNEALLCTSISNRKRSDAFHFYDNSVYGLNISNADVPRITENRVVLKTDTTSQWMLTSSPWTSADPYQQMSSSCERSDASNDDLSSPEPKGIQTSTPNNGLTAPPLVDVLQLKQRESQEGTESGDGVEEKIVYL